MSDVPSEQVFHVAARSDHLRRQASTNPLAALAECIWNALDADASLVEIEFHQGPLALDRVVIRDDGVGMTREEAPVLFRNLGDSWKSRAAKTKGRGRFLHGREGRGRFKAFVLGRVADWKVKYRDGDILKEFTVSVVADDMERGKVTEAQVSQAAHTGTELVISEPPHDFRRLRDDDAMQALTETLAPYLLSYPDARVSVDGVLLDPAAGISDRKPYPLSPVLESVQDHIWLWQSLLSIIRTDAQRRKAWAFRLRHSQSLLRRRQRFNQAMVRSTIQRLGNTTNLPLSQRRTISTFTVRQTRARPCWNFGPW